MVSQQKDSTPTGRNADGTFTKGSKAAKEAGQKGGAYSHDHDGMAKEESVSELEVQADVSIAYSIDTFG